VIVSLPRPNHRRRSFIVRRPSETSVEPDLVRSHRLGFEAFQDDERVVMAFDVKRLRCVAQHSHLAGVGRLEPYRRALGSDIPEHRTDDDSGLHVIVGGRLVHFRIRDCC